MCFSGSYVTDDENKKLMYGLWPTYSWHTFKNVIWVIVVCEYCVNVNGYSS